MKTRVVDTKKLKTEDDGFVTVRKNGKTTVIKSWVVPDEPTKRVSLATMFKLGKS